MIGETSWTDYTVSVRTKIVKDQPNTGWTESVGLALRCSSVWNGYAFGLAEEDLVFALYMQNDFWQHHVVSMPFQWKLNTWYHLKVAAKGDTFKFYVDDELVMDYVDNVHPTGRAGIGVTFTDTVAHFDDFVLTGAEVPDLDLTVAPKGKIATTWGRLK
jgi:hypothetical protein